MNPFVRLIAFYLPQFHPIPENDIWWGKGFTEWTNVTKAKPLFHGHYQPHLPADLGFYDLRIPEVREAQAKMAQEHGIFGFCYYHYWFKGKQLLEFPFNEVLISGKPNFPFCLCWANEDWTNKWNGRNGITLIQQEYSQDDDVKHIQWLMKAFADPRYIRIDNKPLFLVYRASLLPDPKRMITLWREELFKNGIGEIFLCRVESLSSEQGDPTKMGFDASVEFQPDWKNIPAPMISNRFWRIFSKLGILSRSYSKHRVILYSQLIKKMLNKPQVGYPLFHCVTPSWDNSPRRKENAIILHQSTPALYGYWLEKTIEKTINNKNNIIFINAWNEWAEGNHLEPCQRWGTEYLEATHKAIISYSNK